MSKTAGKKNVSKNVGKNLAKENTEQQQQFLQQFEMIRRANEKLQRRIGELEYDLALSHSQVEMLQEQIQQRENAVKENNKDSE